MSEHTREYTLTDMIRLFRCFDGFGVPHDDLWWRTDTKYAPVTMIVNCNDLFFWGCSDCESISPDELSDLEKAITDAKQATCGDPDYAHYLWIARKRGMRPQGAFYKHFHEKMRRLFDACGPEREIGLGNPKSNVVAQETP